MTLSPATFSPLAKYFVRAAEELGYPIIDQNAPYQEGEYNMYIDTHLYLQLVYRVNLFVIKLTQHFLYKIFSSTVSAFMPHCCKVTYSNFNNGTNFKQSPL